MSFKELAGKETGFWTNSPGKDPKRAFRFQVEIGESGVLWYAKKAEKPQVSFTESTHNYLNHTYYWPARAEWNEVTITLVDPVDPDLASQMVDAIFGMGYVIPGGIAGPENFMTISKQRAVEQFGGGTPQTTDDVRIIQIDENGAPLETWTLKHAWIKEVTFGELDYGSEDLTEMTVKFRYDWAQFESPSTAGTAYWAPGVTPV
jgi:hypothetical protein